ncbi:MAG: hypothetical protein IT210_04605 [Armatimonadetes bacterium]|nr:hypothetical protein [Armatimonadota bacterium]
MRTDQEKADGQRILAGESEATCELGFRGADFAPQEYGIAFQPQAMILIGRDWIDTEANRRAQGRDIGSLTLQSFRQRIGYWKTVGYPERSVGEMELPGVYDDHGTCCAAYDFLERFCGVRWYGPREVNIVRPSRKTLTIRGKDVRRSPALKHRNALSMASWPFMQKQWDIPSAPELYLYWRRLRLGGEPWTANHTIFPQTVKTVFNDPEYQAQGPGRSSQICYSHPELVERLVREARDFFGGKPLPEGLKAIGDCFAIVPDDNAHWCACDRYQALRAQGKDADTG